MNEIPISIVLPVRNGEKYLPNLIKSITKNILSTDEIIVVDDKSSDHTSEILESWKLSNSQVRVIKGSGTGIVDALNIGVASAKHNWIARFDVDDTYTNNRLQEQRKYIAKEVSVIFSDYSLKSVQNENMGIIRSALFHPAVSISLISGSRTAHSSALFNKNNFCQVGGYRQEDYPAEDLSLWLRMSRIGKLISIPKVLMEYAISESSITGLNRNLMKQKKAQILNNIGIEQKDIEYLHKNWQKILQNYDVCNNSVERKILLVRDVYLIWKIKPKVILNLYIFIYLFLRIALDFKSWKILMRLFHFKIRRALIRKNLVPFRMQLKPVNRD